MGIGGIIAGALKEGAGVIQQQARDGMAADRRREDEERAQQRQLEAEGRQEQRAKSIADYQAEIAFEREKRITEWKTQHGAGVRKQDAGEIAAERARLLEERYGKGAKLTPAQELALDRDAGRNTGHLSMVDSVRSQTTEQAAERRSDASEYGADKSVERARISANRPRGGGGGGGSVKLDLPGGLSRESISADNALRTAQQNVNSARANGTKEGLLKAEAALAAAEANAARVRQKIADFTLQQIKGATPPSTKADTGNNGAVKSPQGGGLPRVTDKAAYDKLPRGARYIAPDGSTRTKG